MAHKLENLPVAHLQESLQIGKFYSVAHAKEKKYNGEIIFIPIIPFLHKDPQFSSHASEPHYHIDGRFTMSTQDFYLKPTSHGRTNEIVTTIISQSLKFLGIEYKAKKCIRLTTGILPPGRKYAPEYWHWYDSMTGKSCKGRKCPHFGTLMLDNGTHWECPLHGLIGDPNTETIAPNV